MKDIPQAIFGLLLAAFGGWVILVAAPKLEEDIMAVPFIIFGLMIGLAGVTMSWEGAKREKVKTGPGSCDRCGGCSGVRSRLPD